MKELILILVNNKIKTNIILNKKNKEWLKNKLRNIQLKKYAPFSLHKRREILSQVL